MKTAIVGAGAIGGYLAAHLAISGNNEVAVVARGAHLHALREKGVRVLSADGEIASHPFATQDPAEIGEVELIILALKAHSLPGVASLLPPLLGPATPVVAAQNGIPWWYFERHGGPLEGTHLESVDPGGLLSASIPIERVLGCVIYCSAVVEEPGVIRHVEGNRFAIGEPDGSCSRRCEEISRLFQQAGLHCAVRRYIRHDIWVKLIGSIAFNPCSALTGATIDEMLRDAKMHETIRAIMQEGAAVARSLGVELKISIDQRLHGAAAAGAHKTSMLQDLEQGRPFELDSVVGAVVELADRLRIPVPCTRTAYALTRLFQETHLPPRLKASR